MLVGRRVAQTVVCTHFIVCCKTLLIFLLDGIMFKLRVTFKTRIQLVTQSSLVSESLYCTENLLTVLNS